MSTRKGIQKIAETPGINDTGGKVATVDK